MKNILTLSEIAAVIKPLAEKYHIGEVYLFGSYARGEADGESDIDVLAIGNEHFTAADIFCFGEELHLAFGKAVDAYEIREINVGTKFYDAVMKDRVKIA
ncbi:MAG: nucleotidyltransferase domain-containing protein [Oscillospiraceae bacterium]|nr:nucleotidyltransferase domain-containing protein [Oscillospiraceae bacterium]